MTGALVIRWGQAIAGREAKSLQVFGAAIARFDDYAKQGRIHGHREYIALSGRDGGFMIADGEVEELAKIMSEDATLTLNSQASAIVADFEVQLYAGGSAETLQQVIGLYGTALGEIGYL